MKHLFKQAGAGLLACALLTCGAQAATITPSAQSVTLDQDQTTFTVDLRLEEEDAFAAAEFGIDVPPGMTLTQVTFLDEDLLQAQKTPVVTRENRTYFGFFAGTNAFQGGYDVARLTFTYAGEEDAVIALGHSKLVTILSDGSTEGDTGTPGFTVTVARAEDSGGGSGTGGGSGGGSGSGTGGGTIIDEPDTPLGELVFVDVPEDHWARDAIYAVAEAGLFSGTSATTFQPDMIMNRAMLVTVLWNQAGKPAPTIDNPFTDVAQGQWYTDAVLWAYEQGLVKGIGGGLFAPDTVVTREQIATILHRQAGAPAGGEDALAGFTDGQAVSDFAAEAVKWAVESGIINGKPGGQLDPQGTATRAEVAALFARALELI